MNLVIGATGMLGTEICSLLKTKNKAVRALVRSTSDKEKTNHLTNLGAELIQGDLKDINSLKNACKGVEAILSTASAIHSYNPAENSIEMVDKEGQLNLIDAAKESGVKKFVYVSFSKNLTIDFPLQKSKRIVENHLIKSGLDFTILRPTFFMEVWLGPGVGFDYQNLSAKIYGNGDKPISWISYKDVAKFAVASIDKNFAKNAIFELGGPKPLSTFQVVDIFEKVKNNKFQTQLVPQEGLFDQFSKAVDPLQKTFIGLMLCYSQGDSIEMDETLSKFQFPIATVKEYAISVCSK